MAERMTNTSAPAEIVANPPRRNRALLGLSVLAWLAWLGFLIWLAWATG
jgi:hypothetical protein